MQSTDQILVAEEVLKLYQTDRDSFIQEWLQKTKDTLVEALDIQFIELSPDKVVLQMPVGPKTKQPLGYLHGGASVALAESAASYATMLNINPKEKIAFGLEINANHIKSKRDGVVTAIATPYHKGRSTMVWDVKILDENNDLICISRCTMAVLDKRK